MRERSGILTPRLAHESFEDLADRAPFIARQRVRHRLPRVARRLSLVRMLRPGLVLAAVAGGLALGHGLLTSPRFAVAEVEVRGASRLPVAGLLAATGITAGVNIFRVNPEAVGARLERIPGVRWARVIREFPNRVTVVVEERQPFTLIHLGRLHWLDEEGVLLAAAPRPLTPGLPLVSGLVAEEVGSAQRPASDRALTALGLLRALLRSGSPLLSLLSEIDMSRPDGPVFYTVDGTEIRLGNGEWEEQLVRLEGLLNQISSPREPVEYVDLRFRDQVVFKPRVR